MKRIILLLLLLPLPALAAEDGGLLSFLSSFIDWVKDLIQYIYDLFLSLPQFVEDAFAYLIEWAILVKVVLMLHSIEFAHSVASGLIANIGLDTTIRNLAGALSPELSGAFGAIGIFKAINIVCEAVVTRFVLNTMGW
jgi:hypothetical protein